MPQVFHVQDPDGKPIAAKGDRAGRLILSPHIGAAYKSPLDSIRDWIADNVLVFVFFIATQIELLTIIYLMTR